MENKNESKNIELSKKLGFNLVDNYNHGVNLEVNNMVTLFISYYYNGKKATASLNPNRKKIEGYGVSSNDIYTSGERPEINFNPNKDIDKIVSDIKKRLLGYTLDEYTEEVTRSFNDNVRYKNKVDDRKTFLKKLAPKSYRESTHSDKIELYQYNDDSQWIEFDSATTLTSSIRFKDEEQLKKILPKIIKLMEFN